MIGESSTCLDHIFIRQDDYKSGNTAIIETDIIDHYRIYMEIEFRLNDVNTNRSSSKVIDKQIMSRLISHSDLSQVFKSADINDSSNSFMSKKHNKTKMRRVLFIVLK